MTGADGRPGSRLATHTSPPPPLSPSPSQPAPLPPSPPLATNILIEASGGNLGPLLWLGVGLGLAGCCCCSLLLLALARRYRNRHTVSTVLYTGSGCSTAIIRQGGSHADSSRYQLRARARLWRHILGGSGGEPTRYPPVATAPVESATLQELISAAATSLTLARQVMASEGRDDTPPLRPSSQPALRCFASTLHRHSRQGSPSGRFPDGRHPSFRPPHTPNKRTTTLPQPLVRHNGRLFQATQHESTGSTTDPHLPPTNASISRAQAMDWLSDALELVEGVQSRDVSPSAAFPTGSSPLPASSASCGKLPQGASPQLVPPKASPQLPPLLSLHSDFGRNSEFHPMPLAANQQSSSDLAAQNGAPTTPPGMAVASSRKNSRTRTLFPSLGFRLVWNDAAPNASQDAASTFGEYERVRTLGKGSFGTAVLLRHRRTGHMVVSKQVAVQEMERADLGKVNPPAL